MKLFILSILFAACLAGTLPRVKRDYDPRTDAPVRVPMEPEVEGEDRVKRDDMSFGSETQPPQFPPKKPFDRVKRDYDPRTDAPVRVPMDPEVEGEDRVKRFDLSWSPNTEAPLPPPKHHPVARAKRDYDPRTDAPVRVPVEDESVEGEDRVKRDDDCPEHQRHLPRCR